MKTIKIKGEQKGFVVSEETGNKLKEFKKQGKGGWVDLNGFSGDISDIRYIIDGVDEDNRAKFKEEQKEDLNKNLEIVSAYNEKLYRDEILMFLNSSKNKKIEYNLKIASFYCFAFTGLWLKEYVIAQPEKLNELKDILFNELDNVELIVLPKKYRSVFVLSDNQDKYKERDFANRMMMRVISRTYDEISDIKKESEKRFLIV